MFGFEFFVDAIRADAYEIMEVGVYSELTDLRLRNNHTRDATIAFILHFQVTESSRNSHLAGNNSWLYCHIIYDNFTIPGLKIDKTLPPISVIRFFSSVSLGVWSLLNWNSLLPWLTDMKALLSPKLAT